VGIFLGKPMSSETIPAPESVTLVIPAAPADEAQNTDATTTPQAETPAGDEQKTEQQAGTDESLDKKEPTQGDLNRRERNKQRWQEMKSTREAALQRAAAAEAKLASILNAQPPDFSQILDPDDALAERTAWKVGQNQAGEHRQTAQAERALASQAMSEAWAARQEEMRSKVPDFDAVVHDRVPIHARAAPFIVESEKGGEMAYWLGKNPDAALDLYRKFDTAPAQALMELGKLEARLSAPAAKTVSTAPKPASTLSGGSNPLQFDPQKASATDFADRFKKAGIIR
jgi:hypothetical protein